MSKFKKLTEEYEEGLFRNYTLTDLMILKKGNRRVKSNENQALNTILRQKLEEYRISLFGGVKKADMTFRGIRLLEGFPLENEPILKQLYGFENLTMNIQLAGFDNFAVAFDYNLDSGECELQRHSWGTVTNRIEYSSLSEMMDEINGLGYENIFDVREVIKR